MRTSRMPMKTLPILAAILLDLTCLQPAALAKGPPPQVNEADPPVAEQGTLGLDVEITGRNFDDTAVVRFFVTTTQNPGGIAVNSVAFINSNKLVATIDVDEEAVVADFDIEVELLSNGRKGKGTEKFAVLEKGSGGNLGLVTLCGTFANGAADLLRSDTLSQIYCDLEEKWMRVFLGEINGRVRFKTAKSSREIIVDIPDCPRLIGGDCSTDGSFQTFNEWEETGVGLVATGQALDLRRMDEGTTRYADFSIAFPSPSKSTPHLVVFGGSNNTLCGEPLPVTRVDTDTWVITASTEMGCLLEVVSKNNREITRTNFTVPFHITLVTQ